MSQLPAVCGLCLLAPFAAADEVPAGRGVSIAASPVAGSEGDQLARRQAFAALAEDVELYEARASLMRRAVSLAMPSIVHIEAIKESVAEASLTSGKSSPQRVEEAGAGIVVTLGNRYYVITNRHVIHAAPMRSIHIETDRRQILTAQEVWTDPSTDIAVIQVETLPLLPAVIGNSDQVYLGDAVFAVGSPFGLNHTVTAGIISAKGRRNLDLGNRAIDIQDFFQTDAAINPGNSGGPLFNLRGEVIGINTAIASNSGGNEGIGFAIPINMVMAVVEQLVDHGQLRRAYLGVQMDNNFDLEKARRFGMHEPTGALVKAVRGDSPAQRAGFQYGDIILYFNGVAVEDDSHLVQTVGLSPLETPVKAIVLRNGQRVELSVKLEPLDLF